MGNIVTTDALGRLVGAAGACHGAVFLSYTFDARFFEEEVLAAVLQLQEDPTEATRRFLDEGRRKLVETPVLVIADPGMLRGGQRLPYDLLRADTARLFHPKLALLLYGPCARMVVGSGNLTPGGYGDNAELSAVLPLDYARDAGLLRRVVAFVEASGAHGEAWSRFLAELRPRLGPEDDADTAAPWLLHTYDKMPLLDAFLARVPPDAKVERIGVLAPFHQEDGAPPDGAIFDRLLDATEGRRAHGFVLDVGVSWEGNPVAPGGDDSRDLDTHIGDLWGVVDGARGKETTSWFVLGKHVGHNFEFNDGRAGGRRSTRELNALCAEGKAWPTGQLEAFAPEDLLNRAAHRASLRVWLFPEIHRREGRIYRQPLHGKLLAVAVTEGKKKRTHVIVGSPNASAAALLRTGANVECALHLVLDGHYHLGLLCDGLVWVPRQQVTLHGRSYTALAPSPARWVDDAVFDARERRVRVTWRPGAPRLMLSYPTADRRILLDSVPATASVFDEFDLDPVCCELEVTDPEARVTARVPLRIEHVLDLPVAGITGELDLQELLLLHAGRYTPAGIAARRAAAAAARDASSDTASVFGTALSPREVFRALLSIGAELVRAPSLGAFQAQLRGPWGVCRLAERIVEAPERGELMRAEAWIYAQELARVLKRVTFDGDPTGSDKATLRDEVVQWIRESVSVPAPGTPGITDLSNFYEGGL